ncbi:MAG TPA: hypothetical protein VLA46_11450 [Saprospiraceae bacterium]|nr:hypothetical protein [Saprospiraceae bacterium]
MDVLLYSGPLDGVLATSREYPKSILLGIPVGTAMVGGDNSIQRQAGFAIGELGCVLFRLDIDLFQIALAFKPGVKDIGIYRL